ncbi:amidase, putative [Psychroflexus gondwanensis ACAM 44]|uniref:Amidase, putative n=1 Tax=Psychroflexus gondwanensis ACAM 44 TaxID=1189619 RepID=N1WXQ7_9FLAO|nr:amidase family protein [Psychroflexus gondwanensis]EMY81899.1 amidase, putative [Psychroflexus gondwanensis ACAM 44]
MHQFKFNSFFIVTLFILSLSACKDNSAPEFEVWVPYDETGIIDSSADNASERLRYQLIQSKVSDRNAIIETITSQLNGFSKEMYVNLTPYIFDQDITSIQNHIEDGTLTYKSLTQWYLFRIADTETNKDLALNAIISINPRVVAQAEELDALQAKKQHPIYGMPILLKDNINTKNMITTAGAVALMDNQTEIDAKIVTNLKSHGALILGKANLSEWANFLCDGCPNGYSAIGGQTLNPYGPRTFDTGGSSSGSAVSVAANYAVAAIGTETSGSILSPSSQQSSVGLKPTVGVLSQEGIVPISSTLDTPGPITKTISDNSIVFSAMATAKSGAAVPWEIDPRADLKNLRFGVYTSYLEDSLYSRALEDLKSLGAEIIEINPKPMNFEGFTELLSGDMKIDLANYLKAYTSEDVIVKSAADVIKFNLEDTLVRIPYGQARFEGIEDLNLSEEELQDIRDNLYKAGLAYFETPMVDNRLDAMLSINNYNAGQAAAAKYPGLTVPMGYTSEGEPKGLTFIAKPYGESDLFSYAKLFEQNTNYRESPKKYSN